MIKIRKGRNADGYFFSFLFVTIQRWFGVYQIRLKIHRDGEGFYLYKSKRKPMIRHLGLISIAVFPLWLVAAALLHVFILILYLLVYTFGIWILLFFDRHTFDWEEMTSGAAWFLLGCYGIYSIFIQL